MLATSVLLPVRHANTHAMAELQYSQPPLQLDLLPFHTTFFPKKKGIKDLKYRQLKNTLQDESSSIVAAQ